MPSSLLPFDEEQHLAIGAWGFFPVFFPTSPRRAAAGADLPPMVVTLGWSKRIPTTGTQEFLLSSRVLVQVAPLLIAIGRIGRRGVGLVHVGSLPHHLLLCLVVSAR